MKKLIIPTLIFTGLLSITGCASHERNPYMTNKRYSELHVMQMKANEQKRENELKDKRIEEEQWNLFSNDKKLQLRWKKAGFTPKEAAEWKKYLTANELRNQAGAIKSYIRNGLTLSDVKKWRINLQSNKFTIYDIYHLNKLGVNPQEAIKWEKYKFITRMIVLWKIAGFTPEEAAEWKKYLTANELRNQARAIKSYIRNGLTLSDVKKWRINLQSNKFTIYDIYHLNKLGVNPQEAIKWEKYKFITRMIVLWKIAGFTPEEANKWKNYGYSPTDAKKYKKLGLNPKEINEWDKLGFDLNRMLKWKKAGFTPKEASIWNTKNAGISLDIAKKWKNVGPTYTLSWINMNNSPYAKNKYTPVEAEQWINIGVNYPNQASDWKETKLKKSTIKKFVKKGISAKTILKLQKVKAKPTKLTILMAKGDIGMKSRKDFLTKLKILKKNHCKTIDIIHVKYSYFFGISASGGFHNIDEYDNKGKCYQFTGNLIQRIDRKHGLVQNGSFLYYTTFNQSWREGTEKTGVLKGQGAYKYITTEGSRKIIPKGKVLFFDK